MNKLIRLLMLFVMNSALVFAQPVPSTYSLTHNSTTNWTEVRRSLRLWMIRSGEMRWSMQYADLDQEGRQKVQEEQMERIRTGGELLSVPITSEQEAQLVEEGFLPPPETYHYAVYLFETESCAALPVLDIPEHEKQTHRCIKEGTASRHAGFSIFYPLHDLSMKIAEIPSKASLFGIFTITDGNTCKIIPMYTWLDSKEGKHYLSDQPVQRSADTQDELISKIVEALENQK